MKVNFYTW